MAESSSYLAELAMLRNDPELARVLHNSALQGEANAQYAMGLIFALGRGNQYNPVESYAWLTAAAMQGHTDAIQMRSMMGEVLSGQEILTAQERAGIIIMHDDGFERQH